MYMCRCVYTHIYIYICIERDMIMLVYSSLPEARAHEGAAPGARRARTERELPRRGGYTYNTYNVMYYHIT